MILLPGEVREELHHLVPHHRVQAGGGLVQHQQLAWWLSATAMESFIFMPRESSLKGFVSGTESFLSSPSKQG